jgi:uncharacterized OB-fold protein
VIRESAVRIPFRYAAGAAGSRFLAALRDERRILGGRCTVCARVSAPLRSFCHVCGASPLEEIEIGPGGIVQSWTAREDRAAFALILLDGADTAMLHRVLAGKTTLRRGLRVRARFAAERRASVLDIAGFEPVPEGGT